eukprot:gene4975-34754_t
MSAEGSLQSAKESGAKTITEEDKNSEDNNSEDNNSEYKNSEDKNSEDKNSEDNNSEYKNSEDNNSEDKNSEDNNSEDKNSEDNNSEDNNSEDNNSEDNNSEDKNSEDNNSEDNKSEDNNGDGNNDFEVAYTQMRLKSGMATLVVLKEDGSPSLNLELLISMLKSCDGCQTSNARLLEYSQYGGQLTPAGELVSANEVELKRKALVETYFQGCMWVLDMYVQGRCPDYRYCFQGIAPSVAEIIGVCMNLKVKMLSMADYVVPDNAKLPLTPVACALAMLPGTSASRALLPRAVALLMDHEEMKSINAECETCVGLIEKCRESNMKNLEARFAVEVTEVAISNAADDEERVNKLNVQLEEALAHVVKMRLQNTKDVAIRQKQVKNAHPDEEFLADRIAALEDVAIRQKQVKNAHPDEEFLADRIAALEDVAIRQKQVKNAHPDEEFPADCIAALKDIVERKKHVLNAHPDEEFPADRIAALAASLPLASLQPAERTVIGFGPSRVIGTRSASWSLKLGVGSSSATNRISDSALKCPPNPFFPNDPKRSRTAAVASFHIVEPASGCPMAPATLIMDADTPWSSEYCAQVEPDQVHLGVAVPKPPQKAATAQPVAEDSKRLPPQETATAQQVETQAKGEQEKQKEGEGVDGKIEEGKQKQGKRDRWEEQKGEAGTGEAGADAGEAGAVLSKKKKRGTEGEGGQGTGQRVEAGAVVSKKQKRREAGTEVGKEQNPEASGNEPGHVEMHGGEETPKQSKKKKSEKTARKTARRDATNAAAAGDGVVAAALASDEMPKQSKKEKRKNQEIRQEAAQGTEGPVGQETGQQGEAGAVVSKKQKRGEAAAEVGKGQNSEASGNEPGHLRKENRTNQKAQQGSKGKTGHGRGQQEKVGTGGGIGKRQKLKTTSDGLDGQWQQQPSLRELMGLRSPM